ncbi:hypothetical protein [Rickettsia endosymbiont of Pantilius tunicatus]|uniref:hypothetical protein n=1 Tax=Rickettsia endosymbiont of Pantilius tunicatus TaxID=3066267 RepID=UPI00376EAD27
MYQEDSLTEKLAYHTSNIKLHPKDSNGYYMLAQTLEELGTLNINDNANNYFQQALENYNKAISLYKDLIYMAKLSKLYVKLGEHDLEITSIKEMQKYKTSDVLTKEYVDTVVHDVMGMNEVRDTVKNLQSAGKITNEFAIKLQEHINITAELVAAVDAHSRALDEHEKRINEFQIINEKFINGIQVEAEEIDKVKNWATELKRELLKREKEIEKEFNEYEDKNKEIERIESEKAQKEIKKLKKELEKKIKSLKKKKIKIKIKLKNSKTD